MNKEEEQSYDFNALEWVISHTCPVKKKNLLSEEDILERKNADEKLKRFLPGWETSNKTREKQE